MIQKRNNGWLGKKHTEETKIKISLAHKGKKFTMEHRLNLSTSLKGKNVGDSNPSKRLDVRKKISDSKRGKSRPDLSEYNKKYKWAWMTQYNLKYKSEQTRLEKNPNWRGGKSFEPYTPDFNKRFKNKIKQRDNCCMLCNLTYNDLRLLERKVHVHHIDYNKINSLPQNCITLCVNCHLLTNFNREKWEIFFHQLLNERYGYQYTEDQKIILDFISDKGDEEDV